MATFSKTTDNTALAAWQDIASAAQVISSAVDVSAKMAIGIWIKMGRKSSSAFTAGWPNFRIEGSAKSSGNDNWAVLANFQPPVGASISATTANGAISAGDGTCVVTSATNIAVGDYLFLGHTTTASNYELVRVKGISGTTVTFEENCTSAHDNGCVISDQAEHYYVTLDCSTQTRIRLVIDNSNSSRDIAAEARYVLLDSIA